MLICKKAIFHIRRKVNTVKMHPYDKLETIIKRIKLDQMFTMQWFNIQNQPTIMQAMLAEILSWLLEI